MKVSNTELIDCLIIEPEVFGDERGFFLESFSHRRYEDIGIKYNFVQDNHSRSSKGVLRGLHMQISKPQGKLVRVVNGEVFDVAVDLRKDSPSYLKWHSVNLSAENKKQFWVPPGFAHGFLVLSDYADFEYKCTDYYQPDDEITIRWDDPKIGIDWPLKELIISDKDLNGKFIKDTNL
tara:strand:+ start:1735 stop:2268 length:534 start_codon:yes stop_codon:yes gene_type:complete